MIGIVGGGVTGLAVGKVLAGRGRECRVLEARARPGGVVTTVKVEGLPLDLGPQRTRLTGEVRRWIRELKLEEEVVRAREDLPLFIFHDGGLRRVPLSLGQAVTTDLLSLRGKLRILLEPLFPPPRDGETVGTFLRRKMGKEAYQRLLGPLYGGLYASDPDRMYVRHALTRALRELGIGRSLLWGIVRRAAGGAPPACTFREGMAALPRALRRRLGERVRLNAPVRRIEGSRGGFVLHGEGGGVEVDQVVLAVPADRAGHLLSGLAPGCAKRLGSLRYNPLAVVHLRSGLVREGMGYQVAFGEALETRGVTWNASLFGRDGVYTAYLGGMKSPALVERSDEELGALAREEFRHVTGAEARVLHVHRTRVPSWDESWTALEGLELPEGIHLCGPFVSRPGIPGRLAEARAVGERIADQAPR